MTTYARRLTTADFEHYFAIRREALATNPEAFTSRLADFDATSLEDHKKLYAQRQNGVDSFIVGGFADGETIIGMFGLYREPHAEFQQRGNIWGVYVTPAWRGSQAAGKMLTQLRATAVALPNLTHLCLSVKQDNQAAIRFYEKHGFQTFRPQENDPIYSSPCAAETHMILDIPSGSVSA